MIMSSKWAPAHDVILNIFFSLKNLLCVGPCSDTVSRVGPCPQSTRGLVSIYPFYSLPLIYIFTGFDIGSQMSFAS